VYTFQQKMLTIFRSGRQKSLFLLLWCNGWYLYCFQSTCYLLTVRIRLFTTTMLIISIRRLSSRFVIACNCKKYSCQTMFRNKVWWENIFETYRTFMGISANLYYYCR
jgi:hypothetical protein